VAHGSADTAAGPPLRVSQVTVILALGSAIAYGLSDFLGGLFSRQSQVWPVAVVVQASGAACVLLAALFFAGDPSTVQLLWGLLSGLGSGLGTAFLYRGLATGRMSVVAPLSAVGAAVLPVFVGVVTGDRPTMLAWVGIVCALPAIWLVSAGEGDESVTGEHVSRASTGIVDGILAGLGFGFLFVALGQVPDGAGLVPAGIGMAASVFVVIALAAALRQPWVPRDRHAVSALLVGAIAALATVLFQFASQSGLLTIASVLSALYPAFTVLLAVLVLREHIHRGQALGLALAGAAVTLVAVG
jgi:drug/metabolite transporter (DMT)-like permease